MPPDARTYWTQQMDAAHAFVQRLLAWPVEECGEPLCCLRRRARESGVEIVFPEGKKLGRFGRSFHVRQSLVEKLFGAAEALLRRGYVLWIEDGYRSPSRQAQGARSDYCFRNALAKVRWELRGREPDAELVFRRLAVWTATTPKFANHTSGSAGDVWILQRADGARADLVRVLERAKRVLNGKLALFFVRRRKQESVAARLFPFDMRRKRKKVVVAHHRRLLSP